MKLIDVVRTHDFNPNVVCYADRLSCTGRAENLKAEDGLIVFLSESIWGEIADQRMWVEGVRRFAHFMTVSIPSDSPLVEGVEADRRAACRASEEHWIVMLLPAFD